MKHSFKLIGSFLSAAILSACGGSNGFSSALTSITPPMAATRSAAAGPTFVPHRQITGSESVLYSFKGLAAKDGANPEARLIAVNGTLYGTTNYGGKDPVSCSEYAGCGTVYSVSTSGAEQVLYRFKGTPDGVNPYGAGLTSLKGVLYGTTYNGGSLYQGTYDGTVFAVNPSSHVESVVYSFKGSNAGDGALPYGGVIAVKGVLYGTTEFGGVCNPYCGTGTVFKVSTSGAEIVLHTFTGGGYYKGADGGYPFAPLIGVNGTLYGTTADGGGTNCAEGSGSTGCGTVFAVNASSGAERVVYAFKYGGKDAAYPYAGLINVKGTLYGTTEAGGGSACDNGQGCGTVFSVSTSGVEKVLYRFKGGSDGSGPFGGLIAAKGILYGTTESGGGSGCNGNGCGTVFKVSTTGTGYHLLHSFSGSGDGAQPLAGLTALDGLLFGTTQAGGTGTGCSQNGNIGGCGTVFEVTP